LLLNFTISNHSRLRSGSQHITPASAAAVRGANFATAKFRDAYGSPLEAIDTH
jgi:hypothetical protein